MMVIKAMNIRKGDIFVLTSVPRRVPSSTVYEATQDAERLPNGKYAIEHVIAPNRRNKPTITRILAASERVTRIEKGEK